MSNFGVKLARGVVKSVGRLPLKFHYAVGRFISWVLKDVVRYRRDVIIMNIARSFPYHRDWEIKPIVNDFYRHLGEIFAEAIWFGASDYKRLYDSGIVTVTNPEVFNDLFNAAPSMTVLYSHCGNWELLGGFLGYRTADGTKVQLEEEQINVVYKKQSSAFANEFFKLNRVNPIERVGTSCEVESSNILRHAISNRKKKAIYIYIADQFPYQGSHEIGKFMNQTTFAMLGSAGVAHKLGHSVIYLKMKRLERGRYEMTFSPICTDASEMTPEQIMRKYFDLLEDEIRETPCNWLWSHKRWK